MRPVPIAPGPGEESVWDYPRPPRLEPSARRVRVIAAGVVVVDTVRALRLLETSHPPTWYLPLADARRELFVAAPGSSFCEWKGMASYLDLVVGEARFAKVAWTYPDPTPRFAALRDHVALYAERVDACFVDDERVTPQPGGFYGGWITRDVVGPFKGIPGSGGW
jgi:uncharacterized protein (DUF427 family)